MKAMRTDIQAVEKIRKTADELSRSETSKDRQEYDRQHEGMTDRHPSTPIPAIPYSISFTKQIAVRAGTGQR
jgi:hypothetical protein